MTSVNVDTNQSDKLLRLLDTVVIKLEGGTDEDLKVLDEKPNIESRPESIKETLSVTALTAAPKIGTTPTAEAKLDGNEPNDNDNDTGEIKEVDANATNDTNADEKSAIVEEKVSKKRKRTTSGSSSSSSSSTSSSGA